MRKEFEEIIKTLKIEDPPTAELRARVLALCQDAKSAKSLIRELKSINIDTKTHDNQPFYSLLLACMYYESGEIAKAIECVKTAINQFKWCDSSNGWNEAMAHWILCELYQDIPDQESSRQELQTAVRILRDLENELKRTSRYEDHRCIQDILINRLKSITNLPFPVNQQSPDRKPQEAVGPNKLPLHGEWSGKELVPSDDYLTLPWLSVCQNVRAGKSGIVELAPSPTEEQVEIRSLWLDNQLYILNHLRKKSLQDRQITLAVESEWGWAKVKGDSMNAINVNGPINYSAINDGDYVLFRKQIDGEDGDIVIASYFDAKTGKLHYMVKRYKKNERMLFSETNRTGKEYEPVELGKDTQILGVVYAVAKPVVPEK